MTNNLSANYEFRGNVVRALLEDLVGPSAPNETITDAPITNYASGILFPAGGPVTIQPEHDADEVDDYDELSLSDPGVALANVRYPSSMAITFAVDTRATDSIHLSVSAGRYQLREDELWERQPIGPSMAMIDIRTAADYEPLDLDGLCLFVRVRKPDDVGRVSVTAALVNRRSGQPGQRDPDSFFQCEVAAYSPDGDAAIFLERSGDSIEVDDPDIRSNRLLYRHARSFAVGHGCSATWDVADGRPDRATRIQSTFTPTYALPLADSNPTITSDALQMTYLVEAEKSDVINSLLQLVDGYDEWIRERHADLAQLSPVYATIGAENLSGCDEAARRMRRGVGVLRTDDTAWRAFRLATHAMREQRSRSDWIADGTPTPRPEGHDEQRWRPFQIAFILQCIEGIDDPNSDDRSLTDLLWFPTGGGKTEAYLALIAFTVIMRRLRKPDSGGVTALMRYTLRLLTIQQFERAASLMCALESMRRADPKTLGSAPIGIGLWVGKGATPLRRSEARTALNKLRAGSELTEGNPVQLHTCPWCGTRLDHENYWLPKDGMPMRISCKNTAGPSPCEFSDFSRGLPAWVIDEDIYDVRPTLIIATVDKFAGLPWQHRAINLFNGLSADAAPELIIQDELHLISGPLGTLTGLYETAVDLLCTNDGHGPKVIASTATIRRAGRQSVGLFAREVRQFPPAALDARDSYFAVESKPEQRGTRMYVGLMAPGTSHTTLMVRAYAALLQAVSELPASDAVRDSLWTLVGYFNSLRVLGGARMQVQDDVGDRLELLARRHGTVSRPIDQRIELTSRESSSNIPAYLKQMDIAYPEDDALDVILATNMISVGVDIDRLGLMVVMGQPPSTSEYIQSTSRVGRRYPGLVVDLFNASRSRDRSHYEAFTGFHSAIYQEVESTTVTPFAPRARDRALHAVVVGLARMLFPEFRPNEGARAVKTHAHLLKQVKDIVLERVRRVDSQQADATEKEIDDFIEWWSERVDSNSDLVYLSPKDASRALLGALSEVAGDPLGPMGIPRSLRDVDQTSNLYLTR